MTKYETKLEQEESAHSSPKSGHYAGKVIRTNEYGFNLTTSLNVELND